VDTGEDPMRAAINRYNSDGSGHEGFASGTRNPLGLHWFPRTNILWATEKVRRANMPPMATGLRRRPI
jgi:glucose/arabinose dehydrogenase